MTSSKVDQFIEINSAFLIMNSTLIILSIKYNLEIMERHDFLSQNNTNIETTKINDVLSILLPKFIRDRINQEGQYEIQEN